jgi:L-amino acid N-acyltransferase YncA
MPIEFITLTDNTHYRTVKSIYRESFNCATFTRFNIIRSWRNRDPNISYGFYDTKKGEIVGFMLAYYSGRVPNTIYVPFIAMKDSEKGKGTGTIILQQVTRHFGNLGYNVSLVACSSSLEKWYLRNGFILSGRQHLLVFSHYRTRSKVGYPFRMPKGIPGLPMPPPGAPTLEEQRVARIRALIATPPTHDTHTFIDASMLAADTSTVSIWIGFSNATPSERHLLRRK